jgi:hypothetical protein
MDMRRKMERWRGRRLRYVMENGDREIKEYFAEG